MPDPITAEELTELAALDRRRAELAARKVRGMHCWGCGRRFVPEGTPEGLPREAFVWEEGLCDRRDCPANSVAAKGASRA